MAVERNLGGAQRVDDHTSGVRGIPHLELVLEIQRNIAEGGALKAHERELAVLKPRDIVGRADVHVVRIHLVRNDGGDGAGLGNLLGFQTLALKHVHEVHVAADIELVRAVEAHATVLEQAGEHTVRNGRANLALDIVADDRQTGLAELVSPLRVGGDEHWQAVHERAAGIDGGLGVSLVSLLGTNRQVADEDVGLGVAQHLGNVHGLGVGFGDDLTVVLTEAVTGRAALHGDTGDRHVLAELVRVVHAGEDCLVEVFADLGSINVERRDKLDVLDAIATEHIVHDAGDLLIVLGILVIFDALNERRGAVAHASDCHANAHLDSS